MHQTASGPDRSFDADALAARLQTSPHEAYGDVLAAARAGQVAAQLLLAQMHMEGKGTARDPQAALLWYAVAANNGNAPAMNMLGRCHELGEGTPVDFALAATWYRRAAEAGLDWGMYNHANLLARHLEDGLGTARDPQAALAWYRRSAESGDFRGQANYASILLQQGEVEQAVGLLREALAHGSPSFLAHIVPGLAASEHPRIRELVAHLTT